MTAHWRATSSSTGRRSCRYATTDEDRQLALSLIAHACGHIEINAKMAEVIAECHLMRHRQTSKGDHLDRGNRIRANTPSAASRPRSQRGRTSNMPIPLPRSCPAYACELGNQVISRAARSPRLIGEAGSALCQSINAVAYLLAAWMPRGSTEFSMGTR